MRLEALHPLHIRRAAGDLHLQPGILVELPDDEAKKLLQKVPGKVRVAEAVIEPALKLDGRSLSAFYWETSDGRILGPAIPEFLARDGSTFWIVTTFDHHIRWIHADLLRSQRAFERQRKVHETEPVKEPR